MDNGHPSWVAAFPRAINGVTPDNRGKLLAPAVPYRLHRAPQEKNTTAKTLCQDSFAYFLQRMMISVIQTPTCRKIRPYHAYAPSNRHYTSAIPPSATRIPNAHDPSPDHPSPLQNHAPTQAPFCFHAEKVWEKYGRTKKTPRKSGYLPASEALVETAGIPQSAPFPFLPSVSFQIRTKNHRPRRFPPPSAFPVHQTHRKVWDDVWESICGLTKRFSISQEGICVHVVKRTGFGRVCYVVEVKSSPEVKEMGSERIRAKRRLYGQADIEQAGDPAAEGQKMVRRVDGNGMD